MEDDDNHRVKTPQKKQKSKGTVHSSANQIVKSPSDTTIYSPGLRKMSNEDISLIEKISNFVESIRLDGKNRVSRHVTRDEQNAKNAGHDNVTNLTDCEETISTRNEQTPLNKFNSLTDTDIRRVKHGRERFVMPGTSSVNSRRRNESEDEQPERIADQLILQAEKFKRHQKVMATQN